MNKNVLTHLAIFVVVLIALNFFFHLHISVIGSVVLTVAFNLVSRLIQSKS